MPKLSLLSILIFSAFYAQADNVSITEDNYKQIETFEALNNIHKLVGENEFFHFREITPIDNQTVVGMNLDTLYSGYVTDMSKGGSITIPELSGRYISVMVVLHDHHINQVFTTAGTHTIEPDDGFGMIVVRTEVDSTTPDDVRKVNQIQDSISVSMNSDAKFFPPSYSIDELITLREHYAEKAAAKGNLDGMQGARGEVDPYMHILGTAMGWGLLPEKHAQYLPYTHPNGSTECLTATYDVPPFSGEGFFSITMYDKDRWIVSEDAILNKNNIQFNQDGSFDVSFGNCHIDQKAQNHLDTTPGWRMQMRIYEPVLEEMTQYQLPTPVPVGT